MTFYYRTREGQERHYRTATEARRAAQAYANRYRCRITVYEDSKGTAEERQRGARNPHSRSYARNPKSPFEDTPRDIILKALDKLEAKAKRNGLTATERRQLTLLRQYKSNITYKKNPIGSRNDTLAFSSMGGHPEAGLAYAYHDIKRWIKERREQLKKTSKRVANELKTTASRHYVTLKVGPKEITEVFDSASQAKQFAASARKQGFADVIVY